MGVCGQELAVLLQEPLQPRFSRRYFAGAPSAALVARTAAEKREADEAQQSQQAGASAVSKASEKAILSSSAWQVQVLQCYLFRSAATTQPPFWS